MYSVIQSIVVRDEAVRQVSTWKVLATDLLDKVDGDNYIDAKVGEEQAAYTWVVKTSDILRLDPSVLRHLVIAVEDNKPSEG